MGSKILSGRGLKRKRGSVSSVVKKAKNRKKPATNKIQGRGLKKKVRKSKPKKKANKKRRYHDIFS